jgi:hypothetical protein
MDLDKEYLGARVLALESQCKGAHDLIPTARRFAQDLRRLQGEGYDVRHVAIRGIVLRNDELVIPECNLVLFAGELVEKP